MISSTKNEEMSSGVDEKEMQRQSRRLQRQSRRQQRQNQIFAMHCENFARIAKISQGLRKFRNHRENFAILAKFSLCTNFRYDSEISLS